MTREELIADIEERERRMADPLDPMYQEPLRQRVEKDARGVADVIYKRKDDAHVASQQTTEPSDAFIASVERAIETVCNGLAEELGATAGKIERSLKLELREFALWIKQIEFEIEKMKAKLDGK